MNLIEQETYPHPEGTRLIPLTQGQFAIVSDGDYDHVSAIRWYARWDKTTQSYYAYTNMRGPGKEGYWGVSMHRFVMNQQFSGPRVKVDHVDHNTLNNARPNLRVCDSAQSSMNRRKRKDNKSGHTGVFRINDHRWRVVIAVRQKRIHVGYFSSKEEAALAYNEKASELHGEFVCKVK